MVKPTRGRRCCGLWVYGTCPTCGSDPDARPARWGWADRWAVALSWAWRGCDAIGYWFGVRIRGRGLVGRWNGRRIVGGCLRVSIGAWWRWRPVVGLECGALHWLCVRSWWGWEFGELVE